MQLVRTPKRPGRRRPEEEIIDSPDRRTAATESDDVLALIDDVLDKPVP